MSRLRSRLRRAFGGPAQSYVVGQSERYPGGVSDRYLRNRAAIDAARGPGKAAKAAEKEGRDQYKSLLRRLELATKRGRAAFADAESYLKGVGPAGYRRIAEQEARQLGEMDQDLISRGLGNTTIRGSMQQGILRGSEAARQDLDESLALNLSNLARQRGQFELDLGRFGFGGQSEAYQNMPQLAELLQLLQQGGY